MKNGKRQVIDPHEKLASEILGERVKIRSFNEVLKILIKDEVERQISDLVKEGRFTVTFNKIYLDNMDRPIKKLELSTRTRNALQRGGFMTIKDLFKDGELDRKNLLSKRNFGRTALQELEEALKTEMMLEEVMNMGSPKEEEDTTPIWAGTIYCEVCESRVSRDYTNQAKSNHFNKYHPEYKYYFKEAITRTTEYHGHTFTSTARYMYCGLCHERVYTYKGLVKHYRNNHKDIVGE